MAFKILRNDITKVRADAVVNTANPMPVIGRGTDSSIYEAAVWVQQKPKDKEVSVILFMACLWGYQALWKLW